MKNLTLTFSQRLGLTNFLASITGALGKMTAMQRIYELTVFPEEEMRSVTVTNLGNGMSHFEPPSPDFGQLEAQLEESDASILQQELDACQQWRISDMPWVSQLKDELAKPSMTNHKRRH